MPLTPPAATPAEHRCRRLKQALCVEQIRLLYDNAGLAVAVTVLASSILSRLQWPVIPHSMVIGWLGYMLVVALARFALDRLYRAAHDKENARKWGGAFMAGVVFAAAGWGAAAILLYPEAHLVNQVFLAFVLGGMMVGAASVLAARISAVAVFILLSGLPTAIRLLLPGDDVHLAMGLLAALYTAATLVTARRINLTIVSSLKLRFENQDLLASLQKSEHRLELALFGADLGLWDWNVQTGEMFWNAQWTAILDYGPAELRPTFQTWQDLVHPDDRAAMLRALDEHLEGARPFYQSEHRMRTKGGEWKWILARGKVVEREPGARPVRMTGTHRDVTDRRRTEDELRQSRETLEVRVQRRTAELQRVVSLLQGEFAERQRAEQERDRMQSHLQNAQKLEALGILTGGIAHDFNNILTSIIGYTHLAEELTPPGSAVREHLQQVSAAGDRAADLVRRLLVFSRKREQAARPTDVAAEVVEALQLLRASIPSNMDFRQHIDSDCGFVLADATLIHQVVMNLCTNAYQAMKGPVGSLEVMLAPMELDHESSIALGGLPEGPYVKLTVRDNGIGIPAEIAGRIFEPFFTTKEVGQGTGLGLSVVHGIVTGCRGAVTFESTPGEGATFYVYLPRTSAPVEAERKPLAAAPSGTGHILFVDDEESITSLGSQMLRGLGYTVTAATSSLEAIELFRAEPDRFDLVISDVKMPQMTGGELIKAVRQVRPGMPALLISGFHEALPAEEDDLKTIRKPFSRLDLALAIQEVFGERPGRRCAAQ